MSFFRDTGQGKSYPVLQMPIVSSMRAFDHSIDLFLDVSTILIISACLVFTKYDALFISLSSNAEDINQRRKRSGNWDKTRHV